MADIVNRYRQLIAHAVGVTPEFLVFALQPVFDKSQEYVPVRTGALKRSGYIEAQQQSGGAIAEVGYARGGQPQYATLVHELVDIPHAPPTRSKFLQAALEEEFPRVQQTVLEGYRGILGIE